jgi:hypothetical protein
MLSLLPLASFPLDDPEAHLFLLPLQVNAHFLILSNILRCSVGLCYIVFYESQVDAMAYITFLFSVLVLSGQPAQGAQPAGKNGDL